MHTYIYSCICELYSIKYVCVSCAHIRAIDILLHTLLQYNLFFFYQDKTDSPAQFGIWLFSYLDDFFKQNAIVISSKHWHILSIRSSESLAERISRHRHSRRRRDCEKTTDHTVLSISLFPSCLAVRSFARSSDRALHQSKNNSRV